jgi:hypothetical protein
VVQRRRGFAGEHFASQPKRIVLCSGSGCQRRLPRRSWHVSSADRTLGRGGGEPTTGTFLTDNGGPKRGRSESRGSDAFSRLCPPFDPEDNQLDSVGSSEKQIATRSDPLDAHWIKAMEFGRNLRSTIDLNDSSGFSRVRLWTLVIRQHAGMIRSRPGPEWYPKTGVFEPCPNVGMRHDVASGPSSRPERRGRQCKERDL